ncbi:MAG: hypothetical protein ACHQ53_16780, partial [Polyangiales bacterium]
MDLGLARAWRRRALWLVVALSFSCATHGSDASGAGTNKSAARAAHGASPAVATALLTVLSDDPVRLGFGDRTVLRVQLADLDGVPTADEQVS